MISFSLKIDMLTNASSYPLKKDKLNECPILYARRLLTMAERNYSSTEIDSLAAL